MTDDPSSPGALLSFDEADAYLNEVAKEIPDDIYTNLNGGIVLLPDIRVSPESTRGDLYTLGTYFYEPHGLGRYIAIYYGSFVQVCAGRSVQGQKQALKEVLFHELTHHLESMAGVRDLEVKDEQFIAQYRRSHATQPPDTSKPRRKLSFPRRKGRPE